jgi:hypothetical protein
VSQDINEHVYTPKQLLTLGIHKTYGAQQQLMVTEAVEERGTELTSLFFYKQTSPSKKQIVK